MSAKSLNGKNDTPGTLTTHIIKKLQDDLSFGVYRPGSKIPPEHELMRIYGAGRSTIREAIKTLENIGMLTVKQGAGTFVNIQFGKAVEESIRQKRHLMKEVNDVRFLLEKEILIQAIRYRTEEDIKRISEALEDRKEAALKGRYELSLDADIRFHVAIAEATHNNALSEVYRHFTIQLREYFRNRDSGNTSHFAMIHGLHAVLLQNIIYRHEEEALVTLNKLLTNNYWRVGFPG